MGQKQHSERQGLRLSSEHASVGGSWCGVLLVLITGLPGSGKSTMAEVAGRSLGAPVLGHDWAMSGLAALP